MTLGCVAISAAQQVPGVSAQQIPGVSPAPVPGVSSGQPTIPGVGSPTIPYSTPSITAPGGIVQPTPGIPGGQPSITTPFPSTTPGVSVPPTSGVLGGTSLSPTPPATTIPGTIGAPMPGVPGGQPSAATPFPPAGTAPGVYVPPPSGVPSGSLVPPGLTGPSTGAPGVEPGTALLPQELSAIERLIAGRVLDLEVPLRQFGYDLFLRPPTTFAPVTDVPVGPDYTIGPGDSLNIVLWGGVQETLQAEVDRNGTIVLPRLGVVQVWGLTLDQVQNLLRRRFAQFFPAFEMAVTLGRLRTIQVYIVGEVLQPGTYTVSSLSTVINALFASGGPTKNGSLRQIRLVRQGRTVHTLDLYDFLLQGNKSQDHILLSGDTIFVPVIGAVAGVAGNVKRPAIYEFKPGTTLQSLLELAGGVTPLGYLQRVQVERVVANEKKVVVDLNLAPGRSLPKATPVWQTRLADGDLVRVFPITTVLENIVTLEGHVLRPGRYELKPGMRLRDVLRSYNDLLPEPYTDYAEIVRLVPPALRRIVVPFNPGALLAGDVSQNLFLQPQDTVRLFSQQDFADPPRATIEGEVRKPNTYPVLGEMRVKDLVAQAGWVTREAYLERAEVVRLTKERDLIALPFNLGLALQGESTHNLLLQDEDRLVVHNINERNFLEQARVSGLVTNPGTYPLTRGMRVSDLIFRASGVTKFAYLEKAELTRRRISQGGDVALRIEISLDRALANDPEHNLLLEDFDHLLVRSIPDVEEVQTVELVGEVLFPGVYPILKGERLSSVLRRAGGFTSEAYLRGAVLTRPSAKASQEKRLQELVRTEEEALLAESALGTQTALTEGEAEIRQQAFDFRRDLLARLRTVQLEGRVVVHLQPLEQFTGSVADVEVEPGDRLEIPQVPKYVNVLGEVYNRAALVYNPKNTVADYLQQVGGLRADALEKEIYLVQLDGTVISNSQSQFAVVSDQGQIMRFRDFFAVKPQPGDSIVVPRRTTEPATLRNIRDIVQIVFQGISTVGILAALF